MGDTSESAFECRRSPKLRTSIQFALIMFTTMNSPACVTHSVAYMLIGAALPLTITGSSSSKRHPIWEAVRYVASSHVMLPGML